MRIWQNGSARDMTDAESKAYAKKARRASLEEKQRSLTQEEVSRMLIAKQINTLDVDDNTALRMKGFYPSFKSVIGQTVKKGFKFTHGGKLWKTEQPEMTIQAHYPPDTGTESLYSEVCETHSGTEDDPIPYEGNMALISGLVYVQDGEFYRCTRETGNPVYHALKDLVGQYVEVIYDD